MDNPITIISFSFTKKAQTQAGRAYLALVCAEPDTGELEFHYAKSTKVSTARHALVAHAVEGDVFTAAYPYWDTEREYMKLEKHWFGIENGRAVKLSYMDAVETIKRRGEGLLLPDQKGNKDGQAIAKISPGWMRPNWLVVAPKRATNDPKKAAKPHAPIKKTYPKCHHPSFGEGEILEDFGDKARVKFGEKPPVRILTSTIKRLK